MAESIPITTNTFQKVVDRIKFYLSGETKYQVEFSKFDSSLKARQRALAKIWYRNIADGMGESIGYAEAYCKLNFGLPIICENNEEVAEMVISLLGYLGYEEKIERIMRQPDFFPVLRNKGGMNVEQQARYLNEIQRSMAIEGIYLTSPKEEDLLNCKAANE